MQNKLKHAKIKLKDRTNKIGEVLRPQHFHNIFTTNRKWLVIIGSNLNLPLKLIFYLTITTCHLGFAVKIL